MADPQIGIYGLGTMGAALALNLAENGVEIAVANRSTEAIPAFLDRAGPLAARIATAEDLDALIAALPRPRQLLAMIPSTAPMDALIDELIPKLAEGDTLIDAGNADFHATRARSAKLAEHGIHFVGLGVSGGEEGARRGPSMMFGGTEYSWERLAPMLRAIAARFGDDPCVAHLGPDGAGHFVKTVHNGIEYADMQMIGELFDLLETGGRDVGEIADIFAGWNEGPLGSYLFEITAGLLRRTDSATGAPILDVIQDSAGQKGTGRWTVIEAVKLGQSATMIEGAVAARAWSAERDARRAGAEVFGSARATVELEVETLEAAARAARVLEYAQGFRILAASAEEYDWPLAPARIAEIWRAGCIIRAKMLDDIAGAFAEGTAMADLMRAEAFRETLETGIPALRKVVGTAVAAGLPVPVLASALAWFDTMRTPRGTARLIQAQRDVFGRHGFERTDREGKGFHGPWWD
ncbi:NADP-dependent phosphogluconate dehydrogenase [Roseivivax sp. GX 12232]|uniref:NADP-dependent phosphogluconate dehydrogenase n=1 Tax=Roseivivax sp. GX 12232 TaxID=2900547 RepID=UPI001E39AB34|nr:NADP-dependent phosphogluconate dehydrogenase [Roseivivax sp. GX 12232]MCE0505117.1 NADP-dependent phosphogluconate dehydrogenase [Roseivivax sp. GX 12232]